MPAAAEGASPVTTSPVRIAHVDVDGNSGPHSFTPNTYSQFCEYHQDHTHGEATHQERGLSTDPRPLLTRDDLASSHHL